MYSDLLKAALAPAEKKLFSRLKTPQQIQDYLDKLPTNFEMRGETYMSPRRVIRSKTAHCFEGALFAAAALALQGQPPLLMDLRAIPSEEDHVIVLYRVNGLWGAISKTNHATFGYRDPIYRSPRELAVSYFHEYITDKGIRALRAYSAPFDLRRFSPEKWVSAEDDLIWLVNTLDDSRHFPIAPEKILRRARKATKLELRALEVVEEEYPRGFRSSS